MHCTLQQADSSKPWRMCHYMMQQIFVTPIYLMDLQKNTCSLSRGCLQRKDTGDNTSFSMMGHRYRTLDKSMQSPMELLHGRKIRSDLDMSHAVRIKVGHASQPHADAVCPTTKYQEKAINKLFMVGQHVMDRTPPNQLKYPIVIINVL